MLAACTEKQIHSHCLIAAARLQSLHQAFDRMQIVNQTEISRLEQTGVPFFGINLSVGLSLALPGFQKDMAKGLLGKMPFGVVTLVGARSAPDARQARLAGADAVLLKRDMLCNGANSKQDVQQMMMQLSYSFSGDD